MKKIAITILVLASVVTYAQIIPNYGGERAGLSTLSFLKNDLSPRSAGLGGASISLDGDAYSVITNPAALSGVKHTSYALSHLFIGAGINQSYLSGIYPLKNEVSHFAFSINSLNSGRMEERTEFQPEGTGRQVSVSHTAFGATYARKLSELFSAGVTVKYVYEYMAGFTNHNATVDVAFLYETDLKDLQFAVMVQNFGGNSSLKNQDNDLPVIFNRDAGVGLDASTVPTIFKMGASFKPWKTDQQSILVAAQLNHPNDNTENYRLGAEYEYMGIFFVRAGYKINVRDQDYPTFGFSYRARLGGHPLYIDYGANPGNYLGLQHTFGIRLNIVNDER